MHPAAELLQVLESEFAALLREDAAALEPIVARKRDLLEAVSRVAPQSIPSDIRRRLVEHNRRSAIALRPRAQRNAARMQVLFSLTGRAPLYGASGSLAAR
jgi:flagellar biosynthesis/type III secretory pathway chaperone